MTEPKTTDDSLDQAQNSPLGAAAQGPDPAPGGQQGPGDTMPELPIDRARYLRVVRYFAGAILHLFLWEIVLRRILGRSFVERSAEKRWQRLAHRFRLLAVDLGGVLIKLG